MSRRPRGNARVSDAARGECSVCLLVENTWLNFRGEEWTGERGYIFSTRNSIRIFWRITKQSIHLRIDGKINFRAFLLYEMLLRILYGPRLWRLGNEDETWHYVIERANSFAGRAIIFLSFVQIFTLYRRIISTRIFMRLLFEHVSWREKKKCNEQINLLNTYNHFPWK